MNLSKSFQEKVKKIANDPIFDKPIQQKDFSQKGEIKFITKIKTNQDGTKTFF
jgi:hypothetical protein